MEFQEKKYDFRKFEDGDLSLDVKVSYGDHTVWLNQDDIALLFDRDRSVIVKHIKNIYLENELKKDRTCAKTAQVLQDGRIYNVASYNLDIITAIGHRTKSPRLSSFKEWVNTVLSETPSKNGLPKELITFNCGEVMLDVTVTPDEETVWLSQNDMAILFDTTKQNVSLHIKNILEKNELDSSVVKDFFTTAVDGKSYQVKLYNLDMIIAVGYRINSKRGTMFRRWATSILKQYLLNGHVVNEDRCLACTSNIISLQNKVNSIETKVKNIEDTIYSKETVIYEGEVLDAYTLFRRIFFLAKKEIVVTDFYADKLLLTILKDIKTKITVITSNSTYLNKEDIPNNITIIHNNDIHGRYIFIDDNLSYVLDTSFNDMGKKRFLIIKLENITKEMILKDII